MAAALQQKQSIRSRLRNISSKGSNTLDSDKLVWESDVQGMQVGKGGLLAEFKGACGQYEDDDSSSSDALSSTSSTNTSASTLSEEEEFMEEVNAASMHLQTITQQALDLLGDMEMEQRTLNYEPRRQPSFRSADDFGQRLSRRQSPYNNSIENNKNRRLKKTSTRSSKSRGIQQPPASLELTPSENFLNLQMQTHDIVESAREILESINTENCTQYAQRKICAALKQHRLQYESQQALILQQQQRHQHQQIMLLQQQIIQQRRQLRRVRKQTKHARLSRQGSNTGRLSPIPEVHTPASSQTD
eukprot:TRINITY_DN60649_c0_g1_i7.p1 TRINITY_DN60649_c0_g1~~TRINITY_DN60649_c0_g1_i7.p1  ORF type:complete len:303 (+),score=27.89 TRINITY_DN60649_c0_g1_i7:195-1103(+)